MARKFLVACLPLLLLALAGPVCWGQDSLLEEMYGRGVHAYFAHNYRECARFAVRRHQRPAAAIRGRTTSAV